jgi:hypothetical protein
MGLHATCGRGSTRTVRSASSARAIRPSTGNAAPCPLASNRVTADPAAVRAGLGPRVRSGLRRLRPARPPTFARRGSGADAIRGVLDAALHRVVHLRAMIRGARRRQPAPESPSNHCRHSRAHVRIHPGSTRAAEWSGRLGPAAGTDGPIPRRGLPRARRTAPEPPPKLRSWPRSPPRVWFSNVRG